MCVITLPCVTSNMCVSTLVEWQKYSFFLLLLFSCSLSENQISSAFNIYIKYEHFLSLLLLLSDLSHHHISSRVIYISKHSPHSFHSFYTIYKIQEPRRPIWNQRELMGNWMVPVCKSSVALHVAQHKTHLCGRLRLNRTCLVLSFASYQLSFFLYLFYCICLPWWTWQSIVYQMNKREVYLHKLLSNQDLSNILCLTLFSWAGTWPSSASTWSLQSSNYVCFPLFERTAII